jgi:PQQ-like domain
MNRRTGPAAVAATVALALATFASGPAIAAHGSHAEARSTAIRYHLAWQANLDANADSTAVVASNVPVKGKATTVVFVVAGNNGNNCDPGSPVSPATLYAFGESSGKVLWHRSTTGQARCTTAAPVVSGLWVYSPGLDGRIHKYAIATGAEFRKRGWPEQFTKQPSVEKESANLVVSGWYLYATTSGFIGDAGHYEGHVVTVNLQTGHKNVWNSLCSNIHRLITDNQGTSSYCPDAQAGMFGRGQAAIDPLNNDVYVVTGNGPWNGRTDWGDSVLKLNPAGAKLIDAFTPKNQSYLNNSDSDLGSTGPAILPPITSDGKTWNLLVQGGKGPSTSHSGPAVLWLVNRNRMGPKKGPGHLGGSLQYIRSPGGCEVLTAPAVWIDAASKPEVIYGNDCGVTAYKVLTGPSILPHLAVAWSIANGSSTPVISGATLYLARSGEVDAYNPASGKLIWSSSSGAGGTISDIHWEYPAISGDWLFITDQSAKLYAYRRS